MVAMQNHLSVLRRVVPLFCYPAPLFQKDDICSASIQNSSLLQVRGFFFFFSFKKEGYRFVTLNVNLNCWGLTRVLALAGPCANLKWDGSPEVGHAQRASSSGF